MVDFLSINQVEAFHIPMFNSHLYEYMDNAGLDWDKLKITKNVYEDKIELLIQYEDYSTMVEFTRSTIAMISKHYESIHCTVKGDLIMAKKIVEDVNGRTKF